MLLAGCPLHSRAAGSAETQEHTHILHGYPVSEPNRVHFQVCRKLASSLYRIGCDMVVTLLTQERHLPSDKTRDVQTCESSLYPEDGIPICVRSRQERISVSRRALTTRYGHTSPTMRRPQSSILVILIWRQARERRTFSSLYLQGGRTRLVRPQSPEHVSGRNQFASCSRDGET